MRNRSKVRVGPKVIHRHRVGEHILRRVSELVFVQEAPKAVLGWIDMAGDRTPVYLELDPQRLRPPRGSNGIFYYDGVTTDPRFAELEIAPPRAAKGRS
jgi:hypothetical protein